LGDGVGSGGDVWNEPSPQPFDFVYLRFAPVPKGRGGQRIERVRVIDWENAEANDFLVVSQMSIWMQFADTHCGAEVLKVGVWNKFPPR
jgi:hypothetical protein